MAKTKVTKTAATKVLVIILIWSVTDSLSHY